MKPLRVQPSHHPMNLLINRRVWMCLGPGGSLLLGFIGALGYQLDIMYTPQTPTSIINFIDMLFLSVAAVTGTGIRGADINVAEHLSWIGQFWTSLLIMLGLTHRLILGLMLGYLALGALMDKLGPDLLTRIGRQSPDWAIQWLKLTSGVLASVLILQIIGTFWFFFLASTTSEYQPTLWQCWFDTGSAIADCGISILPDELTTYDSPLAWLGIAPLLVIGGLGLPVWWELLEQLQRQIKLKLNLPVKSRLQRVMSLHTQVTLIGLAVVFLIGTLILTLFVTIDSFSNVGMHHSVLENARHHFLEGAFLTLTRGSVYGEPILQEGHPVLQLLLIPLVLIGAGASSATGGLSITMLVVPAFSLISYLRTRSDIECMQRQIPFMLLRMTLGLMMVTLTLGFLGVFIMGLWDPYTLEQLTLQSFSAVANSGLGMTTAKATRGSEVVIICLMWLGLWLGPTLLTFSATRTQPDRTHRYPDEEVILG